MWRAFRRSKKNQCTRTRDVLPGYMDRRLNPEEAARIEQHLSTCQGCREELESLRATVVLLRRLPEVTPSRSFALAPVKPLPGRRVLPALRFATAGAVLLLVLGFAADQTNVFERRKDTGSYFTSIASYGVASERGEDQAYWLVSGVRNSLDSQSESTVDLVVPDHTDNVDVAVNSLAVGGVVYGAVKPGREEGPQMVLVAYDSDVATGEEAEEFTVLTESGANESPFAANSDAASSKIDSIIDEQDGWYLNVLSSDNQALYSFNLGASRLEVIEAAPENGWLRPLLYGLVGLVVVLAGATGALWLRQRRARAAEARHSRN